MNRSAVVVLSIVLAMCAVGQEFSAEERAILMELYEKTGGASWQWNGGWGTAESPCKWDRVVCTAVMEADGRYVDHVSMLWLANNKLRGTLPFSMEQLCCLKHLDVSFNDLTGTIPEPWLERWDRNELELGLAGNAFANMIVWARIEVSATGARCAFDDDVHYFVEFSEKKSAAHFESIRCGRNDSEYRLIRDGLGPSLTRLTRALKRLHYEELNEDYDYPFTGATHGTFTRTTIRFGDGRTKSIQSYGDGKPIELWSAEAILLGMLKNVWWEKERREPVKK